jgi:hypothetical protein
VICATGQVCANGVCAEQCPTGQIKCDGKCTEPLTNNDFCGATDDCQGDNAGETCAEGYVCLKGVCSNRCETGQVNCGGVCVDPLTDPSFCGASGDCSSGLEGRKCNSDESCLSGSCAPAKESSSSNIQPAKIVTAAGGGGCACAVTSGAQPSEPSRGLWAVGIIAAALFLLRIRRRIY